MSMSTSQQETAASLKSMVLAAAPATVCPPNMAEKVLSRRRRRRTRRTLIGAGAATLAGGVLAASTLLGHNPYVSQIQPSGSMEPAIGVLDLVVVNQELAPTRGDVVLVALTGNDGDFEAFSRVMALPGDTIGCPEDETGKCSAVQINGKPISDAYLASLDTKPFPTVTVSSGQMFLLGDNRRAAVDSRSLGTVPTGDTIGVAVEIQTPDNGFRPVPGAPTHPAPDDQSFDPPGEIPPARSTTAP